MGASCFPEPCKSQLVSQIIRHHHRGSRVVAWTHATVEVLYDLSADDHFRSSTPDPQKKMTLDEI